MKKFLQNTYATLVALVVMFAMSASVMAEEVESFDGTIYGGGRHHDGVANVFMPYTYFSSYSTLDVEVPAGYHLTKVKFRGLSPYSSDYVIDVRCDNGSFENGVNNAANITWLPADNATTKVVFSTRGDNYMYLDGLDVYYEENKLDAAVTYTVNFVNAPDDAYLKLGDDVLTASKNTLESDNDYNAATYSEVADSYDNVYADVTFDAASYTFTVTYLPYEVYTVVVEGYTSSSDAWSQPGFYDQSSYINYKNGDVIKLKSLINEEYLFPQEFDGYNVELTVTGTDHNYTIKVTYTAKPAETYEYLVFDAPEGAEVEIVLFEGTDDEIVLTDLEGTFSTSRTVTTRSFQVTEIEGYKSEVSGEGSSYAITFYALPKYTVVVTGAPEGEGGLMFSYVPYTDGQNIYYEWEFWDGLYSAIDVDGFEATVSYDDASKTFTVSYKKASFVTINTTETRDVYKQQDANRYGLQLNYDYYSGCCNIWYNGYLNIKKGALNIEKIVFVTNNGSTVYGLWSHYKDDNDYTYDGFDENTWTPRNDWTEVTIGGGDNYIKAIRVYYKKDNVYNIKNVENIVENVTFEDPFRTNLDYNMDGKISVSDITTLLNVQ